MLKQHLLHPELLDALARLGHGSEILIADGNYPVATGSRSSARRVYLNLSPDVLSVDQILTPIASSVGIESATVMLNAEGEEPESAGNYRRLLPGVTFNALDRFPFYAAARAENVGLVIASADLRHYANLLLVVAAI